MLNRVLTCLKRGVTVVKNRGISDDYEVLGVLGKGSSARVFMGIHLISNRRVVIKTFKQLPQESILKELQINQKLIQNLPSQPANIRFIPLLDHIYCSSSRAHTFIYQFFPGTTLNLLIESLSRQNTLKYIKTLATTLKYVHSIGIIHRDVKPANVLVTADGVRLFDFGLAKEVEEGQELKTNNFGTKCYKTPQVIYRTPTFSYKADIWSLGLILAQCLLNKRHLLPYHSDLAMLSQIASLCQLTPQEGKEVIRQELIDNIKMDKSRTFEQLAKGKGIDKDLIQLVKGMLRIDPNKRYDWDQILSNRVLRDVQV